MSFGRVHDAPVEQQGPVPAYKIVEYNTPWEKEIAHFDEKTRTLHKKQVVIEKGFLVIFPRGHSMLIEATEEALERHGFGEMVPLITMSMDSEVVDEERRGRAVKRVIETTE